MFRLGRPGQELRNTLVREAWQAYSFIMIIGIDPGSSGAISFYDGSEILVWDMPVYEITKGKSVRKRIDIARLKGLLQDLKLNNGIEHVFLEQVSAQPGNGAAHAWTYGFGCGVLEAVVQCLGLPFTYVTPMKWKKDLNCPKDKDAARMRASQLFPAFAHNWDRKKDDGRAEASLIALWGYNQKLPPK